MRKLLGGVAVLMLLLGGVATTATATDETPHKVFVCKYVGTPGVDEVLQTGGNPISVDIAALEGAGFNGTFPFEFSDAQGKSIAIAFDTGQPEPPLTDCPPPVGPPTPHLFAAQTTCNPTTGQFDVEGRVDGLLALITILHIAGDFVGDTVVTVTLGELSADVTVTTVGGCTMTPPPPPPPPPPPGQVTGTATVICDFGARLYRLFGTIDGNAADLVTPATFPGATKGIVEVVVRRGDTSFRATVTLNGDCAPPATSGPAPTSVTVPVTAPPPAAVTPKPKPVVKPKPKPVRKPVAKKPHKKATSQVHKCKPWRGHARVWVKSGPDKGCHFVRSPEPNKLTG